MKKLLSFFVAAAFGLCLSGCSNAPTEAVPPDTEGDLIVIGFSQVGAESDWRTANTESMKSTFSEENGYKLIFDDAQQKQENQITAIRNFIQQEVDYIVLAPVTESGWDTVLQEASDAGIPVIIVDRMIKVSDTKLFTAYIGSDFRLEGDKAADWLEKKYGDSELNIVHIQGTMGSSAQIGRTEGLEAAVKEHENWNIVYQQTGEFTQAKGQEVMSSALAECEDIDVVYCENDNEAFGAYQAIIAAGKTCGKNGEISIISFDATRRGLCETLAGRINFNVECNPLHGPRVEKIIRQLENGEKPDKLAFVDEETFDAETITQQIVDARAY